MNLSVLEVTWDKGVAKSQWWGYWNLTHNHLLAPSHPRPTKRCEWWAEARGALQDHVQAGGWANKRPIQSNWKASQENKPWKGFNHQAGASLSLSKRELVQPAPSKDDQWATALSPGSVPLVIQHTNPSGHLLLWPFQQADHVHSSETSGCPAASLFCWYFIFLGVLLGKCLLISLHRKQSSLTASRIIYCH